ncbi:MAG: SurA N-terminal domain-containing protein [Desulfobulbaceae bacterium]|nr:SurA N-terminal domain-containing protein [Desulfobulbaceae bacterium]
MLDLMRRKAQSPYIQATIVIIILVFVFWGVNSGDGPGRNDAATVNGQSISYQEFQQAYDRTTNQYREQFGGSLPEPLLKMLNIRQQVMSQLVDQTLLLQGAQSMGLRVSDEEIRKTIQEMGSFQNNGTFDVKRYKEVLAGSRLTPANFESSIRTELLTNKVVNALGRFARVMPQEVQNRFILDYETTTIAAVRLSGADFSGQVQVSDEKLSPFYDAHKDNYKTEPQRKLNYLFFSKKMSAATPTEAEVSGYFAQHRAEFASPEERRARHILLLTPADADEQTKKATRAKLTEILTQARNGADFADLAKKHSQDGSAANGGDLGFFGRGRMVPPFEQAAFALKEGQISDIVESQFGFHIIKLEKINPAHQRELAEVKDAIIAKLAADQGGSQAFKVAGDAYEQIILAGSLQKYASANHIAISATDFFTRSQAPAELADKPSLLAAAFTLNKGELSSLVEDDGGYAILSVEDAKAPEIPPLTQVRAQVERDYVADAAQKLAEKAAEDLLAAMKKGATLEAEAQKLNRPIEMASYSRAERGTQSLPATVLDKGLELSASAAVPNKVITDNNVFYVIRLLERKEPAAELLAGKEAELRASVLKENQMNLLTAWLGTLKEKAKISVNQQLLEQQ